MTLNAFGLGTATYDLELRANGQITGSAKMDQGGIVGELIRSQGASDLLNLRASVSGTWEYEEHTEILTLDIAAHGLGQEFREKVQVKTTGREVGEIQGRDFPAVRMQFVDCRAQAKGVPSSFGSDARKLRLCQKSGRQILSSRNSTVVLAGLGAVEQHRSEVELSPMS